MTDYGPFGDPYVRHYLAEHMKIVFRYTHAILTRNRRGEIGVGTAVSFRLGERLFLITAGHLLLHEFQVRLFAGEGPAIPGEVLSHHYHPDSHREDIYRDFGFVEIKHIPHISACQIEQFNIGSPTPRIVKDGLWYVAGCPESGFMPPEDPGQLGLAVVSGFPQRGDEAHIEIDYAQTGVGIAPDGSTVWETDFFATPRGFSGGGAWVLPKTEKGELFVPYKHVKLCGTQFQWDRSRRMLQVMRPRFTLPYFFDWYPELRAEYEHVLDTVN